MEETTVIDYTQQLETILQQLVILNENIDILKGFIAVVLGILIAYSFFSFTFMRR